MTSDRESTPVDKKQALVNCDGDEELFLEIVQIFLEDTPKRIEALSQAVEVDDADQIQKTAHALKGAAANLAAGPLRQASQSLEKAGRDLSQEHLGVLGVGSIGLASLRLLLRILPHPQQISLCEVYGTRSAI